jgi:hypothetical protein
MKLNGEYMCVYTYSFNELCIILFSLYSFCTSTYIASITYLSLVKHGCMENTKRKDDKLYLMLPI